jgi:murein L,D-transpeptidase YafK
MINMNTILAAIVFVLSNGVTSCNTSLKEIPEGNVLTQLKGINQTLDDLVKDNGIKIEELSVLIDKSDYVLSFIHADTIVKEYPVVLGYNPEGDKMEQGDYKTPEGTFGVRSKYGHKSWKYFIWIDYPNEASWSKFNKRKANGIIGKNAKIGGEVGIHGTPEGMDNMIAEKTNWTYGCISLTRNDIAEIYPYIHKEIQIVIRK